MRGAIDFIVALGLEEEVPGLPADHRHQPAYFGRDGWISEDGAIRCDEAQCAEQVQRLVDPTVVVVAVVIPTLDPQGAEETVHCDSFSVLAGQRHKYNNHVTGV